MTSAAAMCGARRRRQTSQYGGATSGGPGHELHLAKGPEPTLCTRRPALADHGGLVGAAVVVDEEGMDLALGLRDITAIASTFVHKVCASPPARTRYA